MEDQPWNLDTIMAGVRRGEIRITLVDGKLYYKTAHRDVALGKAIRQHVDTLERMLERSDSRICCDVQAHCSQYREAPPWYGCEACRKIRADLAERHLLRTQSKQAQMAS